MKYKIGDKVKLPQDETGIIERTLPLIWGFYYLVRIDKATLNETNDIVDFKEEQLTLLDT